VASKLRYKAFKIVGVPVIVVSIIWYACHCCQYYMIWDSAAKILHDTMS